MSNFPVVQRRVHQPVPPSPDLPIAIRTLLYSAADADAEFSKQHEPVRISSAWSFKGTTFDIHNALPVADDAWAEFSRQVETRFLLSSLKASLAFVSDRFTRVEAELASVKTHCSMMDSHLDRRLSLLEKWAVAPIEPIKATLPSFFPQPIAASNAIPAELAGVQDILNAIGAKISSAEWRGVSSTVEYDTDMGGLFLDMRANVATSRETFPKLRKQILREFSVAMLGRDLSRLVLSIVRASES